MILRISPNVSFLLSPRGFLFDCTTLLHSQNFYYYIALYKPHKLSRSATKLVIVFYNAWLQGFFQCSVLFWCSTWFLISEKHIISLHSKPKLKARSTPCSTFMVWWFTAKRMGKSIRGAEELLSYFYKCSTLNALEDMRSFVNRNLARRQKDCPLSSYVK